MFQSRLLLIAMGAIAFILVTIVGIASEGPGSTVGSEAGLIMGFPLLVMPFLMKDSKFSVIAVGLTALFAGWMGSWVAGDESSTAGIGLFFGLFYVIALASFLAFAAYLIKAIARANEMRRESAG